jgi:hypothetical protein
LICIIYYTITSDFQEITSLAKTCLSLSNILNQSLLLNVVDRKLAEPTLIILIIKCDFLCIIGSISGGGIGDNVLLEYSLAGVNAFQ